MASQPPDYNPITALASAADTTTATAPPASATTTTTTAPFPTHPDNNPGPPPVVAQKRQRRPSVRLGEIGDQPAATLPLHDSHVHHRIRTTKKPSSSSSWQHQNKNFSAIKSGRNNNNNRSLTIDLVNGSDSFGDDDDNNNQNYPQQSRKALKSKRVLATTKRGRSNWVTSEAEAPPAAAKSEVEGFGDFDQDSDQSPVLSGDLMHNRRSDGIRVLDNDNYYEVENDSKCDGVRSWLIELGLSRYAPVFEIHEVDDEVLPMLTLEDLKDMGINAVGSRRKLYAAIQKLRHKGFS